MAINQITQVRLPDGKNVSLVDWSERPLYSTIDLHDGLTDQELRLFNYSDGENVAASDNATAAQIRTASLIDTNIAQPSEMDATEEFLLFGISVELLQFRLDGNDNHVTDEIFLPLPHAMNVGIAHALLVLELEVSEKAFPQAPLGYFPAGFGPVPQIDNAGSAVTTAGNGQATYEAVAQQSVPVHLGGTEDYAIILHNASGATINWRDDSANTDGDAVIRARVFFRGLHKRPTA